MDYKDMQEYVQERWEGVLTILEEKKLNDYTLGKAMKKIANHKNPTNKKIQDNRKKKDEYLSDKQYNKCVNNMARAAGYVAGFLKHGKITLNDNSAVVKGSTKGAPEYINMKIEHVNNYLKTCREKGEIGEYNLKCNNGEYTVTIKIAKY